MPERTVVGVDLYEGEDLDPVGGADAYRGKGNNANSPFSLFISGMLFCTLLFHCILIALLCDFVCMVCSE